jgi:hypothetical protein
VTARARTLLAIGVFTTAALVRAQSADDYQSLLRVYREQPALAVQSLTRLPDQEIDRGIEQCRTGRCSLQQIRTAAMLHADAAELTISILGSAARRHIHLGRELLQIATRLAKNGRDVQSLASFGSRWFALTARLLLSHGHFDVARQITVEAHIRYPDSADLFVVSGLLTEWRAGLGWDAGDLRGFIMRRELFDRGLATSGPYRGNAGQELESAAREYRRAIAIEPDHASARLRLAWIHLLANDNRVWEDISPQAMEPASNEARFLAHLLRGTAAERERNFPLALAEYRAARLVLPNSTTACVATSAAHVLNGELREARRTSFGCLETGSVRTEVDAWTLFRLGLMDATTTNSLRDEARRP